MWASVLTTLFNKKRTPHTLPLRHKATNHHQQRHMQHQNRHMSDSGSLPIPDDDDDDDDDTEGTLGDVDASKEKVVLNVGGIRHETLVKTLVGKPGTRLSYLAKKHIKGQKEEFFFDRHPGVFSTVMDYYRSGSLHVPLDVCGAVVKRELDYWMIDDCFIEACCWTSYSSYIDNQKNLSDFNQSVTQENEELEMIEHLTGWKKTQMKIWLILDHPRSSSLALGYALASFMFVLASITGFCIETLPDASLNISSNVSKCGNQTSSVSGLTEESNPYLELLDYICTAFFTIELIVRLIFAPNKIIFIRSIMNIIDILALLPLYVQIMLAITDRDNCLKNQRAVVETIFVLRIIRIFRIFHLVKHYKALKILVHAIRASVQELMMLLIFLFIAMLIFSTLIFYAERHQQISSPGDIATIPMGLWWSIITMTTVGYGDVYPNTPQGFMIGAICALCGVLLVALTIPVISNNFALFYLHARTREQIAEKDRTAKDHETRKGKSKKKLQSIAGGEAEQDSCDAAGKRALLGNQDSISSVDMVDESSAVFTPAHRSPDDDIGLSVLRPLSVTEKTQNETSM